MSAESELRTVLLAHAPLLALVPATRISVDAVLQGLSRPYIVFSKQGATPSYGLDNTLLDTVVTLDIQCIGLTRSNAIAVADAVEQALAAAGEPHSGRSAGYDEQNDIEAEVVTVDWFLV